MYISALTLAEVYKPKGYDPLKPTQNQKLLDYFEHVFVEMVLVDREIGLDANRIAAMYGLSPNDAIHTACALRARCDVILTWDKPFLNKKVPGILIQRPEKRGQQPLPLEDDQRHTSTATAPGASASDDPSNNPVVRSKGEAQSAAAAKSRPRKAPKNPPKP